MRVEYKMSQEQLDVLLEACKFSPVMYLPNGQQMFRTPQEKADAAWEQLGEKLGFKAYTVQPIPGKGNRFFTAEEN